MKKWLDVLGFDHYGGWVADTQFVLQMGQGYLLAIGKPGVPVEDAYTEVEIEKAGKYRIWARCKNWLREYAPGRFKVGVGRRADALAFGRELGLAPTENWIWEIAGDFDLPDGGARIVLRDLTGYYARCAALIVTDDFDFTPPQPVDRLQGLRASLLGLPRDIRNGGYFDVIVAGGGPGGITASLASARCGSKTLLIHSRPVLGGNSSTEAGVGYDGASSRQPHAREGGIAEELRRVRDRFGCSWEEAVDRLVSGQKNLTIMTDSVVIDADTNGEYGAAGSIIRSVIAQDAKTLMKTRYDGRMFIDCTGDGWLGFFAGANYRVGREAAWEYNETLAPESADSVTMSGCLMGRGCGVSFKAVDTGAPVDFERPEWCYKFPPGREWNRFVTGIRGHWWIEHPGDVDDLFDAEKARDELARISLSFFGWLKHDWDEKERAVNYEIELMPVYDAKRENRRFIGDYVLNEIDCFAGKEFPDAIGHTGWTIDVHHPLGVFSGNEGPFHANMHVALVKLPYRCLYSNNIDNLLFAGRDISVTHVALGTVRVQNSIAVAGQAAGTAASVAIRHGTTPRGVYQNHLKELRQLLLRNDQFIPGLASDDPDDMAMTAVLSASSVSRREIFADAQGVPGEWKPLDCDRAGMLPRETDEWISSVWLYLRKKNASPVEVRAHVRKERDPGLFWREDDIASPKVTLEPGFEGWAEFTVNQNVTERYIWVFLEKIVDSSFGTETGKNEKIDAGVEWRSMEMAPLDCFIAKRTAAGVDEFRVEGRGGMMMRLKPPIDEQADCSPEQVINGFSRIISPDKYMWVSESLPAWIELSWDVPKSIGAVVLTFDTDMNNPPMTFPQFPIHPNCVTDFMLSGQTASGEWISLREIKGNYQRRVNLSFPAKELVKVKLDVTATGGMPQARLIEIRCYGSI